MSSLSNISELRALTAVPTEVVFIEGYTTTGDGGEGWFHYNSTDTTTADDGGFVIVDAAGHRWYRYLQSGLVSAAWFGARGDNSTINTTALQNWLNVLSSYKFKGRLPAGIFLTGTLYIGNYTEVIGDGIALTTLRAINGLNANLLSNSNGGTTNPYSGNTNITFRHLTVDCNGSNQTANSYPIGFQYANYVEFDHCQFINPYGTLFWLSQSDTLGSNGGKLATPFGEYFNAYPNIHDCVFDGSTQIFPDADLVVLGSTYRAKFINNFVRGGGANQFSFQFGLEGVIRDNAIEGIAGGMFIESSFKTVIVNNDFAGMGTFAPQESGAWYRAIWLASANEDYGSAAGYATSTDCLVDGNTIHDFNLSWANPVVGIRVSGEGPGSIQAIGNRIVNNRVTNWWNTNTNGGIFHILIEGTCSNNVISNNICDGNGGGGTGIWAGGSNYNGGTTVVNTVLIGNVLSNFNRGVLQLDSTSTGTILVGNCANQCLTGYSIANPGQAGYVNVGNI